MYQLSKEDFFKALGTDERNAMAMAVWNTFGEKWIYFIENKAVAKPGSITVDIFRNYARHLKTCNIELNYDEAWTAMSDTPSNLRGPDYDKGLRELMNKAATCTCGLSEILKT